ncbi:death-inducer obliterator 1-like isoform X2 [Telopea speciosissima]|uniref:death-inducer obliterator 1-like isoform X2 n=1 Tax=Telopea speciosissima TaxID=54955 RepID=UPI001CC50EAF|nr:death-inducer obliterator 1-like isoform X2 [Telopea speciosissima]
MESVSSKAGLQQLSVPNNRSVQMESQSSKPGSQQLGLSKKRTAQMEPSTKSQTESFESVRSKLRESLAASLAMVSQQQSKVATVGKNSESETASAPKQLHEIPQLAEVAPANVVKDELLQGNGLCWATDLTAEPSETMEGHSAKRPKLVDEEVCVHSSELKPLSPETLAFKIEAELFKLYGGVNKKYKEKGRSLLFNLKDRSNPELRERVISGEISPERLCSMTAEELASEELSQWRLAKAEELAHMVVLPDSEVDIRRLVKKTHKGEFQVEVEHDDSVSVEVSVGASSLTQTKSKTDEEVAQLQSKAVKTETSEAAGVHDKNISEDHNLQSGLTTLSHDGTDPMQGLMMEELKDAEFLPPIVSLDEFMESLDSEPPFENLPVDAAQATPTSDEKIASDVDSKLDSSNIGSVDPVDTSLNKLDKNEVKYTRTNSNIKSNDAKKEAKYTRTGSSIKSTNILAISKTYPGGDTLKVEYVWEGVLQLNSATVTVSGIFRSGEKTSTKEWPSLLEIKGRVRLDAFEKFLQELRMSRSRAIMVVQFCWKEGSPDSGCMSLSEVADSYVVDERVGFAEPVPGVELYFCPPHLSIVEMLGKHLSKDHTETLNSADNGLIGVVVWRKAFETSTISPNSSSHHKHNLKKQQSLRRHQVKDTNVNVTSKPPAPLGAPPTNPNPPPDEEPIDDVPPGFGPAAAKDEDDLPEFDFVNPPNPPVLQFPGSNPSQGLGMSMTPSHTPARLQSFHPVEQMRDLVSKYGQGLKIPSAVNWQQSRGIGVEVHPWNDDDDIPEWQPQPPTHHLPPPPPPPPLLHGFQQPTQHTLNPQHLVSMSSQQLLPRHPSQPLGPSVPQQHPMQIPMPLPLQPPQPPMNMTQVQMQGHQTGAPAWQQQGSWWTHPPTSHAHGLPVQPSGSMQPCHYGDQPNEGQFYRTPPGFGAMQHNMERRRDTSRNSRGF